MRLQPIYDIAELCSRKSLTNIVLCPGSRCAPLTLAFSRHPKITTRTFSDERSAGFIALGMAQQSGTPTVMVCTSGTAAYNFSPAVAEAYFSQTPLIVFTADRPAEWIAQHDGQTIYQAEIFGKHVKKSFQLPQEYDHPDSQWAINRIVNEAINLSLEEPRGPVHINAPFREPLYPEAKEKFDFSKDIRVMDQVTTNYSLSPEHVQKLWQELNKFTKILIVAGQHDYDNALMSSLSNFLQLHPVPVIGDIISNLNSIEEVVHHSDVFLGQAPEGVKKSLRPELVISFGKSVISKNLKLFLRKYSPKAHWHIQPAGAVADPFQSITQVLNTTPTNFFESLQLIVKSKEFEKQKRVNYQKLWEVEERRAVRGLKEFLPKEAFGELELVYEIIRNLPPLCNLHLANSMSVRYANIVGLNDPQKNINVFCNRGTSGIDGCTSTAVGHALVNELPNFLITGDLAFFYDRNSFWHNYPLPNLRVIVLNNHGGIIFSMIDGPGTLPERNEYFVTKQALTAEKLCEEFDFDYHKLDNKRKIKNTFKSFFEFDGRTKILELDSTIELNKSIFDNLKQTIKKSYEL
ncbi:MAG TPA: 2-succinyl-5-enolpyruvyl-6-hydroxy-3-cyclohexene-1-carboxylic-acid synthase [Cyclobacteriaceae bacterium]|nr:2-succinyl-5-enolpyruvyl-6-hydroxy-3-cyclohexene-1-carboxylic-acid synthase [Cyclobacteriaceae bacterium]